MVARLLGLLLGCLAALAVAAPEPSAAYAPVAPPANAAALGTGLQRSLRLMTPASPAERRPVRVLFYGQSITEQGWWRAVAEHLRRTFPAADFVIENRAIGGHAAQRLVRTAEADLYDFQPDLVIFHVYGAHTDYESIIRRIRERTVADILMATDHVNRDDMLTEEMDPTKLTPKSWDAWMNHVFLPATARQYGAELVDMHERWKAYLRANHLPAAALLKDGVHLNAHGEFVMAEIMKAHLQPGLIRPDWVPDDRVRVRLAGRDFAAEAGRVTLAFDGNRLDAEGVIDPAGLDIRVDGVPVAQHPELYRFTRTSPFPGSNWPGLLRVQAGATPLVPETWTATIHPAGEDLKQFTFEVAGSVTGPDGSGSSTERFVSRSGRIVLDPADWNLAYGAEVFKRGLPDGFPVSWRVEPRFLTAAGAPADGPVTLCYGLTNGPHVLELRGPAVAGIRRLVVYRPPLH